MRTICLWGTTTVSAGNGVRCLEEELKHVGIDLKSEFEEAEKVLGIGVLPESLFGDGIITGMPVDEVVVKSGEVKGVKTHFSTHLAERIEERGLKASQEAVIGIMVKIKDDEVGKVSDEEIKKGVTNRDATIIPEGASIAGSVLEKVGVDPSTFVSTPLRGAHPGGTARVGIAVDKTMATEVSGLYVADASVLPAAPSAPPILTIVALAKYVSRIIAG